jgi:GTP-binding protein Era
MENAPANYRCGFVSIIGAPNMGKSTLMNALLEEQLCITTPRPQTTRHAILGLLTTETCQVCLFDTPGVIGDPAYKLQEGMMEAVVGAFRDADVLLVVTDLFSTPFDDDSLFQKVQSTDKPTIVCINKVDLVGKVNATSEENLDKTVTVEQAVERWRQLLPNALLIVPLSASLGPKDSGVVVLRRILTGGPSVPEALRALGRPIPGMYSDDVQFVTDEVALSLLPLSPPLYDVDILTDRSERFVASETIRAALFGLLKKELPYCCEVIVNSFKEPQEHDKKPVLRIDATVIVERDSQKGIVVGKGGENIKRVGTVARKDLQEFFQKQVRKQ